MPTLELEQQAPALPPRPSGPVRVALIGCGAIAEQLHLPVLAGHRELQLVALVDRDLERAGQLAKGYGVTTVMADAEQLDPQAIDAAILATPPAHHAPGTIALARRGIHVLVEKPMALNPAEAEAMVDAAERAGVVLSVGLFRRLYPSVRLLKSLIDRNWLGRPMSFEVEGGGFYNWAAASLANMRKDLAGGGVLIDFGSHLVDLLLFVFDGAAEVLEYRDDSLGGIEADCWIRARVSRGDQSLEGTIELARTRKLGSLIRVRCERGTLEFQVNERFRVRMIPDEATLLDPLGDRERDFWLDAVWSGQTEGEPWYETFSLQIDDWVQAIREGREGHLSGRSALRTVKFIDDCYQRPVRVEQAWVSEGTGTDGTAEDTAEPSGDPSVRQGGAAPARPKMGKARGRVLLTGASGFIGGRVAEILHLRDGWDVRAVVHNPGNASRLARLPVEIVQADLRRPGDVERLVEGCDAVVHCAIGTEWGQRRQIFAVTVDGTRRLAEAARDAGVGRFVHLSTMSVYGDEGKLTGQLDESMPAQPIRGSEYGESKAEAERLVLQMAKRGLSTVVLRPARVFGPFSRIFIMRPIEAISEGRFAWIGSPDVPSDMVYVDNVVEMIVRSLDAEDGLVRGQVFNASDGDPMSWRAFYQRLAAESGLDVESVPQMDLRPASQTSRLGAVFSWPGSWYGGLRTIIGSPEFRALGSKALYTPPVGTLPRRAFERFPSLQSGVRRLVGADDSLPVYRRETSQAGDTVVMGSAGATLNIEKARRLLGYAPPVTRARALELTADWVKHARIV